MSKSEPVEVRTKRRLPFVMCEIAIRKKISANCPAALSTYIVLLEFANWRDGKCKASQGRLATEAGITSRTLRKHLQSLEQLGILNCQPRQGQPTIYLVTQTLQTESEDLGNNFLGSDTEVGKDFPGNLGNNFRHTKKKNIKIKEKENNYYPPDFLELWSIYPRKKNKRDAALAWKATRNERPDQEILMAAVERQKLSRDWRKDGGKFIPYPASWLRAGAWDDEPMDASVVDSEKERTNLKRLSEIDPSMANYGWSQR